jgi:hypothetical protein
MAGVFPGVEEKIGKDKNKADIACQHHHHSRRILLYLTVHAVLVTAAPDVNREPYPIDPLSLIIGHLITGYRHTVGSSFRQSDCQDTIYI